MVKTMAQVYVRISLWVSVEQSQPRSTSRVQRAMIMLVYHLHAGRGLYNLVHFFTPLRDQVCMPGTFCVLVRLVFPGYYFSGATR